MEAFVQGWSLTIALCGFIVLVFFTGWLHVHRELAWVKALTDHLAKGSYILGERFSAADILWGTALTWMTMFKVVPELPVIMAYIGRINARPSIAKVRAQDAALSAAHEKAAKG